MSNSGLFGSGSDSGQPQPNGGLFGSASAPTSGLSGNASASTGGLFGASTTPPTPGLFGTSTARPSANALGVTTTPSTTMFTFGTTSTPAAPSLFRSTSNTPAPRALSFSFSALRKSSKKIKVSFSAPPSFVTFVVGAEDVKKSFVVHKHLVCQHSPYFKTVFESDMEERETQSMRLGDVDTATFGLLVHWLYTQEIEDQPSTIIQAEDENSGSRDPTPLAKLYFLAQRALIPHLQDAVMERLVPILSRSADTNLQEVAEIAFADTKDSPLKRLLVDRVALGRQTSAKLSFSETMKLLPPEMVGNIAQKLRGYYEDKSIQHGDKELKAEDYLFDAPENVG